MWELDPLSYGDSKKLLCKRVFNENEEMHSQLEEVTRKILKKCGGIPLAIITVASLLATRPNKTKYEWYGVYSSMGSGLHKDKSLENMREILYLSYSDLPSHLKPCLLYLSMFPEDYEIQKDDLVRLWIAEGFIDEKQGSDLYDLGERYFNELVNRSMIQPIYDEDGSPEACQVHDMILDLIISLSAQENFVTILEGPCQIPSGCNIRRLSLQGSKSGSKQQEQMMFPETLNISHVRSLVVFGDAIHWMPPMSRFPVLRVLSFKTSGYNIHREGLETLHHLRYLEIEEIGYWFKIYDGRALHQQNLDENQSYMKTFLQTLSNLVNLRTLILDGYYSWSDCMPDQWTGPARLQRFNGNKITFTSLPGWFSSLSELSRLFIRVFWLKQDDIDLLGALPVLCFLDLVVDYDGTIEEEKLVVGSDNPFRSLADFKFWHNEACWLEFAPGVMPKLQRLKLPYSEERRTEGGGFDIGLENLGSLKHVTVVVNCSGARIKELEDVEDKVRDAIDILPNHPTLELLRLNEYLMKRNEDTDEGSEES